MSQDTIILLIFSAISLIAIVTGLIVSETSMVSTGSGMLVGVAVFWLVSRAIRAYRGQR